MREFAKVTPQTWRDRRFKGLSSSDARLAYLYCVASEHQNSSGVCRLPALYACADLAWTNERYMAALAEVVAAGLIVHDPDTDELYCVGWYGINPAMNPSHGQFIERRISEIESDFIREAVETEFLQSQEEREARRQRKPANVHPLNAASDRLLETGYLKRGQS